MAPIPGWYPDPGGVPGLYRYWDGTAWSARTTTDPSTPPPTELGTPGTGGRPAAPQPPRRSGSRIGWWLGGAAVLLAVIVVVVVLLIRQLSPEPIVDPAPPPAPTGSSTQASCPETQASASPAPGASAERVTSGPLSYPKLGSPWSDPIADNRVPFGVDVRSQSVITEANSEDVGDWSAGVLIARLLAGDGFFEPEQGAELVATCIEGVFYGNNEVERNDMINEAMTVDGHDAWVIESELTFDIPGIEASSELMIIVVVDTVPGEAGLYYASIPGNAMQLEQPAREALSGLRVK